MANAYMIVTQLTEHTKYMKYYLKITGRDKQGWVTHCDYHEITEKEYNKFSSPSTMPLEYLRKYLGRHEFLHSADITVTKE